MKLLIICLNKKWTEQRFCSVLFILRFFKRIKPSEKENVCDKCGASLYIRNDDAAETVKNRLDTYHNQTEPLKAYYGNKGILATVEGQEKVEDTTALVFAALEKFGA